MTKISLLSIVLLSLMNIVKSQSLVGIYGDTYGTASGIFLDPTHDIAEVAQPTPANTDGGMALLFNETSTADYNQIWLNTVATGSLTQPMIVLEGLCTNTSMTVEIQIYNQTGTKVTTLYLKVAEANIWTRFAIDVGTLTGVEKLGIKLTSGTPGDFYLDNIRLEQGFSDVLGFFSDTNGNVGLNLDYVGGGDMNISAQPAAASADGGRVLLFSEDTKDQWNQLWIGALDLSALTTKEVHFSAYSSSSTTTYSIQFYDDAGTNVYETANFSLTAADTWETFTYDLSVNLPSTLQKLGVFLRSTEVADLYIDDIYFGEAVNVYNGSWSLGSAPASTTQHALVTANLSTGDISCDELKIANGRTLSIATAENLQIAKTLTLDGNMTIGSGGSLINMGSIIGAGEVTASRNTRYGDTEGRYSFVGSPFESSATNTASDFGANVYVYDESEPWSTNEGQNRWTNELVADNPLVPGKGYTSAFKGLVTISGTPNTGNIDIACTYNADALADYEGWNLVANPYPCAIDVHTFLTTNASLIDGFVAIWDDPNSEAGRGDNTDYLIVNSAGQVGASNYDGTNASRYKGYIPAMQGFFVKLASTSGTLQFTDAMKISGNNDDGSFFRKSSEKTEIRISLKGDFYNETLISFIADATDAKDWAYDAVKLSGNTGASLYTLLEDSRLAIQGVPNISGYREIALGYDLAEQGQYSIELSALGLSDQYEVFILDQETGVKYSSQALADEQLTLPAGKNQGRFLIIIEPAVITEITDQIGDKLVVYTKDGKLILKGVKMETGNLRIYDMQGRTIMDNNYADLSSINLPNGLVTGQLYLFKISDSQSVKAGKFINQ